MDDELQRLRDSISKMLKRVPNKVNGASVQVVRQFKDFHKKATAELGKSRLSKDQLNTLYNKAIGWYQ